MWFTVIALPQPLMVTFAGRCLSNASRLRRQPQAQFTILVLRLQPLPQARRDQRQRRNAVGDATGNVSPRFGRKRSIIAMLVVNALPRQSLALKIANENIPLADHHRPRQHQPLLQHRQRPLRRQRPHQQQHRRSVRRVPLGLPPIFGEPHLIRSFPDGILRRRLARILARHCHRIEPERIAEKLRRELVASNATVR